MHADGGIVQNKRSMWQGHPDVAYFNRQIYVTWRESENHKANKDTSIKLTYPSNSDFTVFKSGTQTIFKSKTGRFNCPRLKVIGNKMWIICDFVNSAKKSIQKEDDKGLFSGGKSSFVDAENQVENTSILRKWTKDGTHWSDEIKTNMTGILPDRIFPTKDNHFLVATHCFKNFMPESPAGSLVQSVWRTNDLESGSWIKHPIPQRVNLNLCEGSIVGDTHGKLMCIMRENSQKGLPAFVSFSVDQGRSWSDLHMTRLYGCHRPSVGRLNSGRYLITYRHQVSSFKPNFWARNVVAALVEPDEMFSPNPCQDTIMYPLDHDNSQKPDGGYTGWVQLDNGSIYIVNYITKDHRRAYIRYYIIREEDF